MRKYALALLVVFSVLIAACGNIFAAGGDMGVGTEPLTDGSVDYPYLIEDFNDFEIFRSDPNYWGSGVCTRLDCNLDLDPNLAGREVYTTAVIAGDREINYVFDGSEFMGSFDGNGHTISNLTVDGAYYCGFFGYIGEDALVSNLGLENISVTGIDEGTGGLVSRNYHGSVTSSYSTGLVNGNDYVGGLVGENSGSVTSSYSACTVTGNDFVGGLVGGTNEFNIADCYFIGTVIGKIGVGGLVGYNNDFSITNCYSTGKVTGETEVGGLVGNNYSGNIMSSYSTVAVVGNSNVGGLVGENGGIATNSYSTGAVTGDSRVGGLVGANYMFSITNCYSTGTVTGETEVGGLVGDNYYHGSITGSFWGIETSGLSTSDGGIGKTTAEMRTVRIFLDAGWDLVMVWNIEDGQTYPLLRKYSAFDTNYDNKVDLLDFAEFAEHWLDGAE